MLSCFWDYINEVDYFSPFIYHTLSCVTWLCLLKFFPHFRSNVNVNIWYQSTYPIPIDMRLLSIHVDTHDFSKHVSYYIDSPNMSISTTFEYLHSYLMSKLKNLNTNIQLVCWNGSTHPTHVKSLNIICVVSKHYKYTIHILNDGRWGVFSQSKFKHFLRQLLASKSLTQEDEGVSVGADSANHPG